MKNCFFCEVQNNKEKNKITENKNFFSIYDDNPVSRGHVLIVPKKHLESFFDLSSEQIRELYDFIKETKNIIQKKYNPDGYNIGVNDGEAAGRTIHHLHIHLIPRYLGDIKNPRGGIRNIFPEKGDYTNKKLSP